MKKINLMGRIFGRWTVIKEIGKDKYGNILWLCKCTCKNHTEKIVNSRDLRNGDSKSCGCLCKEMLCMPKTDEHRKKLSKSHKGKRHTDSAKKKMSNSRKGIPKSDDHKRKIGEGNKGKVVSEKTRKKLSEINTGKHHTEETRRKLLKLALRGSKSPRWNPTLTNEDRLGKRIYSEYIEWRKEIFERDNYTCQKCGDNKGGNLNAHHIESFNNNPELRVEVSNGVTLCEDCHLNFHHQYGYGNNNSKQCNKFINNTGKFLCQKS